MKLTLAEKFLILVIKPHSSTCLVTADQRNAGFIGAIMQDLKLDQRIELTDNKVRVLAPATKLSDAHQHALDTMNKASREKRASTWFGRLTTRNRKYRYQVFAGLEAKGLVKLTNKKVLFFKYKVAYLTSEKVRQQLVQDLKKAVADRQPADKETVSLLLLIKVCKMYKLLGDEKAQVKQTKEHLKHRFTSDPLYRELGRGMEEMQAAATIAAVV